MPSSFGEASLCRYFNKNNFAIAGKSIKTNHMQLIHIITNFKKQNIKSISITFLMLLIFTSCSNQVKRSKEKIIGNWIIEEFSYKGEDLKGELNLNFFSFKNGGSFSIPEIQTHAAESAFDSTLWVLTQNEDKKLFILMKCKNPMFNNLYSLSFFTNDEIKGLGIVLRSKTTFIKAYKTLQNYDQLKNRW